MGRVDLLVVAAQVDLVVLDLLTDSHPLDLGLAQVGQVGPVVESLLHGRTKETAAGAVDLAGPHSEVEHHLLRGGTTAALAEVNLEEEALVEVEVSEAQHPGSSHLTEEDMMGALTEAMEEDTEMALTQEEDIHPEEEDSEDLLSPSPQLNPLHHLKNLQQTSPLLTLLTHGMHRVEEWEVEPGLA